MAFRTNRCLINNMQIKYSSQNYFTQMKEKMTDLVRGFLHRVENILCLPTLYQSFDILQ